MDRMSSELMSAVAFDEPNSASTEAEVAYIGEMLEQLQLMALGGRHDMLAYLIDLARQEANAIVHTDDLAENLVSRAHAKGEERLRQDANEHTLDWWREELTALSGRGE